MSDDTGDKALPFVSVIVPVFDDRGRLDALLGALSKQDYPADRFECVVVDNESMPGLRQPQTLPFAVQILHEGRPGSYAARNCGVRAARGRILAFTDVDCRPRADWLTSAVSLIGQPDSLVMIGGKVDVEGSDSPRRPACAWHTFNTFPQSMFVTELHFAATANMVTTRRVFDRVGEFDATLFSLGDRDWGWRAHALGVAQMYSDDVVVGHSSRCTWTSLARKARRITGGMYQMTRAAAQPRTSTARQIIRYGMGSIRQTWHDPEVPGLVRRLQIIGVDVSLRIVQLLEVVRLRLGARPARS